MTIFHSQNTRELVEFLQDLQKTDLAVHANSEVAKLETIFKHVIAVLPPYADTPEKKALLTIENIQEAYKNIIAAHQAMSFNEVIILNDELPDLDMIPIKDQKITNFLPRTGHADGIEKPPLFAFLVSERQNVEDNNNQTLIVPYVRIPQSFMGLIREAECDDLLKEFANICFLVNHDWWHTALITGLNEQLNKIPETAPIKSKSVKNTLAIHLSTTNSIIQKFSKVKNDFQKIQPADMEDTFEGWALRFHYEVLKSMLAEKENPLAQAIQRFMKSWKKFSEKIKDTSLTPQEQKSAHDYALKLLSFASYRAAPPDHPVFEENIQNADALKYIRSHLTELDQGNIAEYLFGKGPSETPEEYSQLILKTSMQALALATDDANEALIQHELKLKKEALKLQIEAMQEAAVSAYPSFKNISYAVSRLFSYRENWEKVSFLTTNISHHGLDIAAAAELFALQDMIDFTQDFTDYGKGCINDYPEYGARIHMIAIYQFAKKGEHYQPYDYSQLSWLVKEGAEEVHEIITSLLEEKETPLAKILMEEHPEYVEYWLAPPNTKCTQETTLEESEISTDAGLTYAL